jgi:thioredoxin-like negative regulator of GroEL
MAVARSKKCVEPEPSDDRPILLLFLSPQSGASRRVQGFLAQVLQRRRNHETFRLREIDVTASAALAERFAVEEVPSIVVVDGGRVRVRVERPRGCTDIQKALASWLK